jgi:AAA15 family ATPase/GTPase
MLDHLEIENFKSVKNIELDCKRINIFIGEQ